MMQLLALAKRYPNNDKNDYGAETATPLIFSRHSLRLVPGIYYSCIVYLSRSIKILCRLADFSVHRFYSTEKMWMRANGAYSQCAVV